jgi:hemolysin activation/secretion protein
VVRDVVVDGVTAYPPGTIAKITAGLTGPEVPQSQIETARAAIVNLYRGDGYVFTAVSAFIKDGELRFVVTEGHITDVKLEGDIGASGAQAAASFRRSRYHHSFRAAAVADGAGWARVGRAGEPGGRQWVADDR